MIDTSIYQNIRPIEVPSVMDAAKDAASLSQISLQNKRLTQQTKTADREEAYTAHLQKASQFGTAMEGLAGLPPDQQAAAYPKVRGELIQSGVVSPEDMPEQHDRGFIGTNVLKYRQSKEGIDRQLEQAKTAKELAEAAKYRAEAGTSKTAKNLTPGEKSADEVFGKDAGEYYYGGGKATVEKNVQRLQDAIDKLKDTPNLTGGITTRIPLLNSDSAQDTINPKLASVRDEIRGAIQASLRATLGPQFTEKEGEAIFNRAFNPRLSADENVKRATTELDAIKRMAAQKDQSMKQFISAGTLKGYRPAGTDLAGNGPSDTQTDQPPATGGLGVQSANASDAPPAPKMIRMQAPNGAIKLVPLSKKGEAIASGGKVVN